MMIRYWNPAQETETLSRQLDRLFDDFMGVRQETTWTPAIEVIEKGDRLELNAYLPGVEADNLDVQVTRESVLISGQRKREELEEGVRSLYSDVRYGQFRRLIELPIEVQNSKVEAAFDHGILTLMLPKVEAEQNKVVKLSLGKPASQSDETSTEIAQ